MLNLMGYKIHSKKLLHLLKLIDNQYVVYDSNTQWYCNWMHHQDNEFSDTSDCPNATNFKCSWLWNQVWDELPPVTNEDHYLWFLVEIIALTSDCKPDSITKLRQHIIDLIDFIDPDCHINTVFDFFVQHYHAYIHDHKSFAVDHFIKMVPMMRIIKMNPFCIKHKLDLDNSLASSWAKLPFLVMNKPFDADTMTTITQSVSTAFTIVKDRLSFTNVKYADYFNETITSDQNQYWCRETSPSGGLLRIHLKNSPVKSAFLDNWVNDNKFYYFLRSKHPRIACKEIIVFVNDSTVILEGNEQHNQMFHQDDPPIDPHADPHTIYMAISITPQECNLVNGTTTGSTALCIDKSSNGETRVYSKVVMDTIGLATGWNNLDWHAGTFVYPPKLRLLLIVSYAIEGCEYTPGAEDDNYFVSPSIFANNEHFNVDDPSCPESFKTTNALLFGQSRVMPNLESRILTLDQLQDVALVNNNGGTFKDFCANLNIKCNDQYELAYMFYRYSFCTFGNNRINVNNFEIDSIIDCFIKSNNHNCTRAYKQIDNGIKYLDCKYEELNLHNNITQWIHQNNKCQQFVDLLFNNCDLLTSLNDWDTIDFNISNCGIIQIDANFNFSQWLKIPGVDLIMLYSLSDNLQLSIPIESKRQLKLNFECNNVIFQHGQI